MTLSGIPSNDVRALQPANADVPIAVTFAPIPCSVTRLEPLNALSPILDTPSPIPCSDERREHL